MDASGAALEDGTGDPSSHVRGSMSASMSSGTAAPMEFKACSAGGGPASRGVAEAVGGTNLKAGGVENGSAGPAIVMDRRCNDLTKEMLLQAWRTRMQTARSGEPGPSHRVPTVVEVPEGAIPPLVHVVMAASHARDVLSRCATPIYIAIVAGRAANNYELRITSRAVPAARSLSAWSGNPYESHDRAITFGLSER